MLFTKEFIKNNEKFIIEFINNNMTRKLKLNKPLKIIQIASSYNNSVKSALISNEVDSITLYFNIDGIVSNCLSYYDDIILFSLLKRRFSIYDILA